MRSDLLRVVICGAALALAGQAVAEGTLNKVEARTSPKGSGLQIIGKGLKKPTMFKSKDGSTIFQFNATLPGKGDTVALNEGPIKTFWYGWFKSSPKIVRVKVRTTSKAKPTISRNTEGWLVTWPSAGAPKATALVAPEKKSTGSPTLAKPLSALVPEKAPAKAKSPAAKASKAETPFAAVPAAKTASNVVALDTRPLAEAFRSPAPSSDDKPKPPAKKARMVSLDFVNTDIVQILKALALQSRVNIVTSPDVAGKLTVSLNQVTVERALDLVTTMSGLAYDVVGGTYIVAAKDKIFRIKGDVERVGPMAVTQEVVPIYSGEGTQIKAALVRSLPAETEQGTFDIALPSEKTVVQKVNEVTGDAGKDGASASTTAKDTTKVASESGAEKKSKDPYVVVTGSPSRVKEIAAMVKKLDEKFCEMLGIKQPSSSAVVRQSYAVKGGLAEQLVFAVAGNNQFKFGNVELHATPANSKSEQTIVAVGRQHEVDEVMRMLAQLDSNEQLGDEYAMYDVKFVDPRALREAVIAQVPGLRASVPPASAGNPRLYEPDKLMNETNQRITSDANSNGAGGGSKPVDPKVTRETGNVDDGLAQPFNAMETAAVPMRLLLRGTPEQLQAARGYLAMVDIAPKQIALELRVMELSKEDAFRLGIDWNIFTGGAVSLIRLNQSLPTAGSNSANIRISGDRFGADITATLDSIANKTRLIARPNLLAIDGRESEIFVGDIVRYVANKTTNPTTGELQIQVDQVPVGVRLAVMPRIGADGSLTMDLRPVVSSITGFLDTAGVRIPQTSSRIAQSTVNIQSGETIAIGGLIQEEDVRNISKVPILGDLPIIGALFRRTDTSKVRREVVFFLTARQVTPRDRGNAADPRQSERNTPVEMPPLKKNGGG